MALNTKNLRTIGSIITADGKMLILDTDYVSGRFFVTGNDGKLLTTPSSESKAWDTMRYQARITHSRERSPFQRTTEDYDKYESLAIRELHRLREIRENL